MPRLRRRGNDARDQDMSWAGCYALDLYCDNPNGEHKYGEFPHQYTAELGSECRSKARKAGWVFKRDGTCICPKCSGKGPAASARSAPTG